MNKPNKIIIHHSATTDGLVLKDFDAIKRYHINHNGWRDIGYHYVVESVSNQYQIIPGRPENDDGAHCIGQNSQSIGICLVGNFIEQEPPEAQIQTLIYLIKDIYSRHGQLPIYGHRDFYATSCPGKLNIERVRKLASGEAKTEVKTAQEAIQILVDDGILQSPDYWLKAIDIVKQLDLLFIRIANTIKQKK
jgi:hypothetical protein